MTPLRSGVLAAAVPPIAAAAMVAGVALPWVTVGPRRLSGFDLVTIGRSFGNDIAVGPLGRAWLALPLAAAGVVALATLGHRRSAAALCGVVGLGVGAAALAVWRMAGAARAIGPVVVLAASAVALISVPFGVRGRLPANPLPIVKIPPGPSHHAP